MYNLHHKSQVSTYKSTSQIGLQSTIYNSIKSCLHSTIILQKTLLTENLGTFLSSAFDIIKFTPSRLSCHSKKIPYIYLSCNM